MMIDGAAAVAEAGIVADGRVDEALGARDGIDQRQASGEAGGNRGGVSAAGAVGVARVDARGGEFGPADAVVEQVEGIAGAVAAFDEDGAGAHLAESLGGTARVGRAGKSFCFGKVG